MSKRLARAKSTFGKKPMPQEEIDDIKVAAERYGPDHSVLIPIIFITDHGRIAVKRVIGRKS